MTITSWLLPDVMRPAGWALLHFLWQGTALAALAALAISMIRRASARYVVAVGVLAAMLAAPIVTFFYYRASGVDAQWTESAPATVVTEAGAWKPSAVVGHLPQRSSSDVSPLIVEIWLAGVFFFSLRSVGGLVVLERMRRRQSQSVTGRVHELCLELQERLRITRAVRYCQCAWLEAPAVIGWVRPVVFLPITTLTGFSELQLRAIIAHELAHIKRFDAFVNGFQVVVETLLFYHPAVWWLNRRIRLERENCCDDVAIELCGNAVEYARALTLMEEWRSAPAMAMAANRGPLSARIMRLLGISHLRSNMRGIGLTVGAVCLSVALVAANAIFGITGKASAQGTMPAAGPSPNPAAKTQPVAQSAPAAKPSPARPAGAPADAPVSATSYIESMKAAGIGDMTVDDLIGLKIQGVTPEYVQAMKQEGMRSNADTLIAMKVQGVTPEHIRELRAAGLTINDEQIIGMKVHGINAAYIRALQQEGIRADADDVIAMKVQGVTPEYVRGLKDLGFQITADQIIGMKVQRVTPEYIREVRTLGLQPTADEVVGMKVQGITSDYIKSLQTAGLKFDVDDLIGAKVQGITPDFIEKARRHGFQNLTLDKLIQLKHLGVLDKEAEI